MPRGRRNRVGVWLSFVVHLVVILLLVQITRGGLWWEPPSLSGDGLDQGGGGGAGREVTMIPLAPAPAAAPVVKPTPVVVPPPLPPAPVEVPTEIPPPVATPPPADTIPKSTGGTATTGSGGGTGGGSGTGAGPGTGAGTGPGSGTGPASADSTGIAGRPPEPRRLILPPFDYPKSMRGTTIQVTFFVLADGRVDHVVFGEGIPDRGYAKKLEAVLLGYLFRPARSPQGLPIPGHTTVSISF